MYIRVSQEGRAPKILQHQHEGFHVQFQISTTCPGSVYLWTTRGLFNVKKDFCIIFISLTKNKRKASVRVWKTSVMALIHNSSDTTNVYACCFMLYRPDGNHLWHLRCCFLRLFCCLLNVNLNYTDVKDGVVYPRVWLDWMKERVFV